ncbi:tRNA-uridine aminocarboxypropyltransferase [Pseudomonas wadenswilerensis]|uniref:tRNA-uridine aminocarboxypropyltransferase n=1 Tax=Pseudomonas wadenswilerensis TaxID=1785161 RepID=UPI00215E7CEA|nr:DTW domain-containing protein [Pseudomonas wadenswilerensis]UVM23301.1 DTW domain-containing protein [Pseudomonas wadenswilerensis]
MSRIHCERCLRPQAHCLCPLIPSLDSRTRVLLLQHPSEVRHALNTAKLAALGLRNAQLQVGEVFEDLAELLEAPGYRSVLLFPGDEAQPLVAYGDDQDDRPWQLVVPDGTWRKASKLLHLNPLLGALPRVTLTQVQPSRYRLRKAPQPGALSTLEAVVQALNVLEAPQNFDALLKPFEALIEGQIAAMGRETYERNHLR